MASKWMDLRRIIRTELICALLCLDWLASSTTDSATSSTTEFIGSYTVSKGSEHTCALEQSTGLVTCWGDGTHGQLGQGAFSSSGQPVAVEGLVGAAAVVSAGGYHSCAVELDSGAVKCWGQGQYGQLGHGGKSSRFTALPAVELRAAQDVDAGGSHSCALERSGAVKCWGLGDQGQLGNGIKGSSRYPVSVIGLAGPAAAICSGGLHSCAAEAQTGSVRCWGWSSHGQLGPGTKAMVAPQRQNGAWSTSSSATPLLVEGVSDAVALACGYMHTCALLSDGSTRCWGDGVHEQLQDDWDAWQKTARRHMLLDEAVLTTRWTSPMRSMW